MQKFSAPKELLELMQLTIPDVSALIEKDHSLASMIHFTKAWILTPEQRLNAEIYDRYAAFNTPLIRALSALGLRETKYPRFEYYDAVVIFGSTGLSHFKIWKDLIFFTQTQNIKFSKIFLLGATQQSFCKFY